MTIQQFYHNNQFIIKDDYGNIYLQSYDSVVARIANDCTLTLGTNWNYSNTTLRHLYRFIDEYGCCIKQWSEARLYELELARNKSDIIYRAIKNGLVEVVEL